MKLTNELRNSLQREWGIHFHGAVDFLPEGVSKNFDMATDAQPALVTVSNSGIPAYLANYLDPKIVEILVSPMKAAQIIGETKKGDWTTETAQFPAIEYTGEVSAYGDYSENGGANANTNFNTRQAFQYQVTTKWGDREMEMAGLAKIDWASRLNIASILTLNKFQNKSYFFGVSGLKNYGLLNDPSLVASIAPTAVWTLAGTSAEVIWEDIRRIFAQLQSQSAGVVDHNTEMVLAMSPTIEATLLKTNTYGVNVLDIIKKNFPNTRVENAVEYLTTSGELVQLIATNVEGQDTATAAFTEKLRTFPIIVGSSSFHQKKAQGSLGCVIFRPFLIAGMIGV